MNTITENWHVANVEYGQLAAAQLLREGNTVTAISGGNDEIAASVWKELVKRRIDMPRAVSLIGVGDRKEFLVLEPSLTTVSVLQEELGRGLARMLLAKLSGRDSSIQSKMLLCKIIERGSCAPPRSEAQRVRKS